MMAYIAKISALGFTLLLSLSSQVWANAKVQAIQVWGEPKQSAGDINVSQGASGVQTVTLSVGQELKTGTRVQTPASTRMQLLTSNGNVLHAGPRSDIRIVVSKNSENHVVNTGSLTAQVRNAGDFFSLSSAGKLFQGLAEGTTFGLSVDESGVKFQRSEGDVKLIEQVPVNIRNANQGNTNGNRRPEPTVNRTSMLTAAQPQAWFDPAAERSQTFNTYADAIAGLDSAIQSAMYFGDKATAADTLSAKGLVQLDANDPRNAVVSFSHALKLNWELIPSGHNPIFIDDYTNLGYAYLDASMPGEALDQFVNAMNLIMVIDPEGPLLAESLLDQVEAHLDLDNADGAWEILPHAIGILESDIDFGTMVFEELMVESNGEPTELAAMVALEVGERLISLGWAYEISGRRADADGAYKTAKTIGKMLAEVGIDANF